MRSIHSCCSAHAHALCIDPYMCINELIKQDRMDRWYRVDLFGNIGTEVNMEQIREFYMYLKCLLYILILNLPPIGESWFKLLIGAISQLDAILPGCSTLPGYSTMCTKWRMWHQPVFDVWPWLLWIQIFYVTPFYNQHTYSLL